MKVSAFPVISGGGGQGAFSGTLVVDNVVFLFFSVLRNKESQKQK